MKLALKGILLAALLLPCLIAKAPTIPFEERVRGIETHRQIKFVRHYKVEIFKAVRIVNLAQEYSQKYGIDVREFLALVAVESSFRPKVTSGAGAVGYVQHIDRWHPEKIVRVKQELGYYDRFDMRANFMMGFMIMKEYKARYGHRWAQAYNGSLRDSSFKYTKKIHAKMRELTA